MLLEVFSAYNIVYARPDSDLRHCRPSPKVAFLITLIVKAPIIQIFSMFIGIGIVAIEYPLPFFKDTSVARSFAFKAIMLIVQAVFAIMYYQVRCSLPFLSSL